MIVNGKIRTTVQLREFGKKGDVKSAVRLWDKPGYIHKTGDRWQFWMEDDPRSEDGILKLATYRCFRGGDDDAQWEQIL